uniref:Galactosylgalactosylxylosylprotein 3-beta-glucuronosyltransferase n=1 Tax=Caenorhabditis japonica TaxID=281687 RepID=A0A8R1IHS4_CAEJA
MIPSRIVEKWWFRAFIALLLFFTWQLFYAISKVQSLDEEKVTLQATIEVLTRKSDELRRQIFEKERNLHQLNGRVEEIDTQIRDHLSLLPRAKKSASFIYFITPTHFRAAQKADLTRLSHTLSHVPNLHWIVVEDSDTQSPTVREILKRSRLPYTHLNARTPTDQKMKEKVNLAHLDKVPDDTQREICFILRSVLDR